MVSERVAGDSTAGTGRKHKIQRATASRARASEAGEEGDPTGGEEAQTAATLREQVPQAKEEIWN